MNRKEYSDIIRNAAFKIILDATIKKIIETIPFFSLGIPGYFLRLIAGKFLGIVFDLIEMEVFFLYTDMRTSLEQNDFEKAALRNIVAQQNGTDQEKKDAEANLINSFRKFAKLV
jgi:hypothetical protein